MLCLFVYYNSISSLSIRAVFYRHCPIIYFEFDGRDHSAYSLESETPNSRHLYFRKKKVVLIYFNLESEFYF